MCVIEHFVAYQDDYQQFTKLSINLFIYESGPNHEEMEDVLCTSIKILNLLCGAGFEIASERIVSRCNSLRQMILVLTPHNDHESIDQRI